MPLHPGSALCAGLGFFVSGFIEDRRRSEGPPARLSESASVKLAYCPGNGSRANTLVAVLMVKVNFRTLPLEGKLSPKVTDEVFQFLTKISSFILFL